MTPERFIQIAKAKGMQDNEIKTTFVKLLRGGEFEMPDTTKDMTEEQRKGVFSVDTTPKEPVIKHEMTDAERYQQKLRERKPDVISSFIMGLTDGVTMGFAPQILAASKRSPAIEYSKETRKAQVEEERKEFEKYREAHPIASGIGELASYLIPTTPVGAAGKITKVGAKALTKNIAKAGVKKYAESALQGAAEAAIVEGVKKYAETGDLGEAAKYGAMSSLWGGGFGAAGTAMGQGAEALFKPNTMKLGDKVVDIPNKNIFQKKMAEYGYLLPGGSKIKTKYAKQAYQNVMDEVEYLTGKGGLGGLDDAMVKANKAIDKSSSKISRQLGYDINMDKTAKKFIDEIKDIKIDSNPSNIDNIIDKLKHVKDQSVEENIRNGILADIIKRSVINDGQSLSSVKLKSILKQYDNDKLVRVIGNDKLNRVKDLLEYIEEVSPETLELAIPKLEQSSVPDIIKMSSLLAGFLFKPKAMTVASVPGYVANRWAQAAIYNQPLNQVEDILRKGLAEGIKASNKNVTPKIYLKDLITPKEEEGE